MKNKYNSISSLILISSISIYLLLVSGIVTITSVYFNSTMKDSSNDLVNETTNQINYNYDNFISSILTTSNNLQHDLNNKKEVDLSYQNSLNELISIKPEILNICLYDMNGDILTYDSNTTNLQNVSKNDWFINSKEDSSIHFLSPSPFVSSQSKYRFIFSKSLYFNNYLDKLILKMEIDFEYIIDLNYKTNLGEGGHITIVNQNNSIIYASDKEFVQNDIEIFSSLIIGTSHFEYDGHYYTLSLQTIPNTNWRIGVTFNTDWVYSSISNFMIILFAFAFVVLVVGICILLIITKSITNPIKKLENTMCYDSNIELSKAKVLIDHGPREITNLSNAYNSMIDQINNLMQSVITEQKNQRKSELKALQNQINPHFLYNTLDSIVWLIENDKKEDAQKMVIALAKLFRISISRGNNIIPIRDEFEHVRNYLLIQSMRYTDSFDYYITLDPECEKYKMMKLILQPLVENCIYHGLKNRIDRGIIKIDGKLINHKLYITIFDNGYGMKEEKIKELYERFNNPDLNDGVGLKNVYQRLHLYYGNEAYLEIDSEVDEYTKIIICIPVEEI